MTNAVLCPLIGAGRPHRRAAGAAEGSAEVPADGSGAAGRRVLRPRVPGKAVRQWLMLRIERTFGVQMKIWHSRFNLGWREGTSMSRRVSSGV